MKKAFFVILAVLTVFAMVSCGGGSNDPANVNNGGGDDSGTTTEVKVKIKFDANIPESVDVADPEAINDVEIPEKTAIGDKLPGSPQSFDSEGEAIDYLTVGLYFRGWFTAATAGTQVTAATVFEADATVYAQWLSWDPEEKVLVIFNYNFTGAPADKLLITDKDEAIADEDWPTDPTRAGTVVGKTTETDTWAFKGWKEYESGTGKTFTQTVATTDKSRTVYAGWEPSTGWPTDIAPDGTDLARAEKVVLANSNFVMYQFNLPVGKTLDNYSYKVQVSYLVGPAAIGKNNGARAIRWLGNYSLAELKEKMTFLDGNAANLANNTDDASWKGDMAIAGYNELGNNPRILTALAAWTTIGAAAGQMGVPIRPWEWFTLTYTIDGSGPGKDGGYAAANLPTAIKSGPLYFGIGIPDNNDGGNSHYIRDVTLVGTSDTASLVGTPLYVKKGDKTYPAFVGWTSGDGTSGVKEYYRKNCDGTTPGPIVNLD